MCGICGFIVDNEIGIRDWKEVLGKMKNILAHRGPDTQGQVYEATNKRIVGLGHRRLSIIDLSEKANQPLGNEDDSATVVFNGEIYNYQELAKELVARGHRFRSQSDTEVLVHLYEEYGRQMVDHLNGMFAFAIYDRGLRRLLLARDRLGIKPLYYTDTKEWLLFGSEIKSFVTFPEFNPEMDREALHHYLTFRFVPAPMTLFRGVKKLPPGFLIEYLAGQRYLSPMRYWDLSFDRLEKTYSVAQSTEAVRDLLQEAVKIRLMSEVPLGAMLSGGVDSSVIVSDMIKSSQQTVSTFTITYEEEGPHNEGVFAEITAEAFQTDHHEILVRLDDFIENLERMVYFMDEPVADPAAIPIYNLCRFSKEHVTVLLSGVGGDELFGGYDVYREAIYSAYLRHIPRFAWDNIIVPLYGLMPEGMMGKNFVQRVHQPIEDVFLGSSIIYGGFNESQKATLYTPDFAEQQSAFNSHNVVRQTLMGISQASPLHKMIYMDTKHWLADSHLIMMDKMSMANSLELRTPLLDHRLVELAAAMPEKFKVNLFRSKIIFKNAFKSEIPEQIITRPKRGFSTPVHIWFNESGDKLRDMLVNRSAYMHEYFNKDFITNLLRRHIEKEGDFSASLFTLLVLELWFDRFLG